MNIPIIEFENVSYSYMDQTSALKSISFNVITGKKVAVLGNNGAGKSTLFLHFNGILKPTNGSIRYNGEPLLYKKKFLTELRRNVGIVFQNPDSQIFCPTVLQDVMYGLQNLGLSKENIEKKVEIVMDETGIKDLGCKPTHFLSQGQKKKVALAGVLAMDPEVILLDEPTAQLDPVYTNKIMDLLNAYHAKGKTIMLSTHDVNFAYEWADEIMIINDGELLFHGDPYVGFENETILKKSQLSKPWIVELYDTYFKGIHSSFPPKSKGELYAILNQHLDVVTMRMI